MARALVASFEGRFAAYLRVTDDYLSGSYRSPRLTVYYNTKSANIRKALMMLRFVAFTIGRTTFGTTSEGRGLGDHPGDQLTAT
jgi:hypothetical protein